MTPARFIVLDGVDGSGKSSQVRRLAARLAGLGVETVTTREPGGSPRAERIRGIILSGAGKPFGPAGEALLFAAARFDHVKSTIAPALARGAWVICDRFTDSTLAYQGYAGSVPKDFLRSLERVAVGETKPDLTLVLDVPVGVGLARAAARRGSGAADRFEDEPVSFYETLREAFLDIAASDPDGHAFIDADRPEEAVAEEIWDTVRLRFALATADPGPN